MVGNSGHAPGSTLGFPYYPHGEGQFHAAGRYSTRINLYEEGEVHRAHIDETGLSSSRDGENTAGVL